MFFTPFAFVQQPYAVSIGAVTYTLLGYYVGGDFTSYSTNTNPYFRMLDSSGSISSSFNMGVGFNFAVNTVATQSDGKILAGGGFTSYSGSGATRIVRINTDGTADTAPPWNTGAGLNAVPNSIAVQSDGKILVGGGFTRYSGSGATRIARLNIDGTIDTGSSWNTGAGFDNAVRSILVQSDGKIVTTGYFTTYSGSIKNYIARLNTDGTADTGSTWNTGTGSSAAINQAVLQTDQKIIIAGTFTTYSGSVRNRMTRLNTDGTIDSTFSIGTAGFNNGVQGIALEPNGKIIAVGSFTTYSGSTANRIVRINTNGSIDTTFKGGTGFPTFAAPYLVSVQPDNKVIVQGVFPIYSGSIANAIIRLNSSGAIDSTYNRSLSINTATTDAAQLCLSNGSTIVGGNFTGDKVGYVTFLDATGSTTQRSIISSYGLESSVYALATQSNGTIIGTGVFSAYSGSSTRMFGLSSSGLPASISEFNPGGGPSSNSYGMTVQPDGKIIIVGFFGTYSGSTSAGIARINTNGTYDSSFKVGTGAPGIAYCSAIQSDGKVLIGGTFTTYSGSGAGRIARINTDGTIDTGSTWNSGAGITTSTTAFSLAVQADQKILVGGTFSSYSGSTATRIARINTNGTYDSTFKTGAGFNNSVDTIAIQSDQKVLAGGQFTTYSGSAKNYIARLNTDGTADTGSSWNQGTGFNNTIRNIVVQPDGKIVAGGSFTTYSGSTANRIARINSNGTLDTTLVPTGSGFNGTVQTILPIYSSSIS